MSIVVTCYNCRKEFFAIIKSPKIVTRCPHCFKPNRIRTIVGGKAQGEYYEVTKSNTMSSH